MLVKKPCDKVSKHHQVEESDDDMPLMKTCDKVSPPPIVPVCDNKGGENAPISVALSGLSLLEEMAVAKAFTIEPIQPCMQLDGNYAEAIEDGDGNKAIEGGDGNKAKQKKEKKKLSEYNEFVAANMKDRTLFRIEQKTNKHKTHKQTNKTTNKKRAGPFSLACPISRGSPRP